MGDHIANAYAENSWIEIYAVFLEEKEIAGNLNDGRYEIIVFSMLGFDELVAFLLFDRNQIPSIL
jgi:hypothetical protein